MTTIPTTAAPVHLTRTTCPYCGVGCGVLVETDVALPVAASATPSAHGPRDRAPSRVVPIRSVRGDPGHPANFGRLCSKGSMLDRTATAEIAAQSRALEPELRPVGANGRFDRDASRAAVGWDAALEAAADRFAAIVREHGPDAVAFYVSGQLLTEDYYVFNKLAKGLLGTNNIDTNSRLCMSSAVAGYKATLGADAPPGSYADLDHANLLFVAGSNAAWAHPVLWRRVEAAREAARAAGRPMRLVVVDPRHTETAEAADLHLAIRPGTDVALFHGMLHAMLRAGWTDRAYVEAHTTGFDALRDAVREWTPAAAAEACGIAEADLLQAAEWFARSPATLSLWCMGLNQSANGTAKNAALVNLHLATGQIGRPGAGPMSLTGQPNAMGGREVGGLANLGSAHRDLSNPVHRAETAALWGVPDVPAKPGLTAIELFDALAEGRVRAVWIACTNPAMSMPDAHRVHEALRRAEFVVVQEAYRDTETAAYADLLLPATTWAEKDGTVTNSERRISRVRPARAAPGVARHDWAIAADFARRLERRLAAGKLGPWAHAGWAPPARTGGGATLFPWADDAERCAGDGPEAIWNEHRESTRGRDLDICGLSYATLDRDGPQQWPYTEGATRGTERLYADGRFPTPDGRARFAAVGWQPPVEATDEHWPVVLNTGRLRDQWHGMTRTGTTGRAFEHAPEPEVRLAPQDLQRHGLGDGALVQVASRRGALVLPARADPGVPAGQAFVAMHWGGGWLAGRGVNALTSPAVDPVSRQPELKQAAVRIEPAELPWCIVAFGWSEPDRALERRRALTGLFERFGFATATLFGRDATGVALRAAADDRPAGGTGIGPDEGRPAFDRDAAVDAVLAAFGADASTLMRYDDPRRGAIRRIAVEDGRLRFVLLAGPADSGDLASEPWLRALLADGQDVSSLGTRLLMASAQAPVATVRGATVCTCIGVDAPSIDAAAEAAAVALADTGHPLEAEVCTSRVRERLKCGSQCGSCLPEVRRRVAAVVAVVSRTSSPDGARGADPTVRQA